MRQPAALMGRSADLKRLTEKLMGQVDVQKHVSEPMGQSALLMGQAAALAGNAAVLMEKAAVLMGQVAVLMGQAA